MGIHFKDGAFYRSDITPNIPPGSVEISNDFYLELFKGQANGKMIVSDENGKPVLEDKPPLSIEKQIELANEKKLALLSSANIRTQIWQTQLLLGMISDADKASLATWMVYCKSIQSIDTSEPSKIVWPETPTS